MKSLTSLLLFLTICTLCAQEHYQVFDYKKDLKKPPFNFEWVEKGKLAILISEVTIDNYLGFLEQVSADSSAKYIKKLIPSEASLLFPYLKTDDIGRKGTVSCPYKICWIDEDKFRKDYGYPAPDSLNKRRKEYLNPYNKPITGITYEQANEFAKWCTRNFNQWVHEKDPSLTKAVIYRLPTPEEFEKYSRAGIEGCDQLTSAKDKENCRSRIGYLRSCMNEQKCALCNYYGKDSCASNKELGKWLGDNLWPVEVFNPSWIGTYDMQGNAAEMTSVKGIAKGGSYLNTAAECAPEAVQNYTKPEKWLGFRLVAEVVNLSETVYYDEEHILHW